MTLSYSKTIFIACPFLAASYDIIIKTIMTHSTTYMTKSTHILLHTISYSDKTYI